MPWLKALTEFGDLGVLMPLATVMLIWLLLIHSPRGMAWWTIAVIFCTGLTAVFKVFFYTCPPTPDLHSPSGHTSFSTLVYGAMTLVTARQTRGLQRIVAIIVGACFVLAIAASRLLLAHNASEVGLGLAIGIAALILFGQGYWRHSKMQIWLSPLFAAGGAVLLVLHGRELDAEQLLGGIARYLQIDCP